MSSWKPTSFADGHDAVVAELQYRFAAENDWTSADALRLVNDCWTAEFKVSQLGEYFFRVVAGSINF